MKKRIKNKELELEIIYGELFDKMVELVLRTNEPQMVASTMMAQSLRLYKTVFKYPGEFKEVRYYFRAKTGLILAITGEINQESFSKSATLECKKSNELVLITNETGVCGIR